ncbi:MAG: DUF4446 family protein [Fimbriimonadaceae bacterium]|nr:DUF4446 family protein [Fimbriimonadaceae bacterium]
MTGSAPLLFIVLGASALVLGTVTVVLAMRIRGLERRLKGLMDGSEGTDLQAMLESHHADRRAQAAALQAHRERLDALEARVDTAKRFSGLVRYDAFEDVRGEQSFSLALFDDDGNGLVITSQVGRTTSRVFGKKLVKGRPDRDLSEEEQAAVDEAAGRRRSHIS